MARGRGIYTRLLGRGRRRFGMMSAEQFSLWLGPDHVLHARKFYFTERYKRFHFRDIQAISISRTDSWGLMNAALFVVVLLAAALGYAINRSPLLMAALAALPSALLVYNSALGPTCACWVFTAVQAEHVVALCRLRKARRALDAIRPLIEAEQGPLDTQLLDGDPETQEEILPSALRAREAAKITGGRYEYGRFHKVFFILLFVLGISSGVDIFWLQYLKDHIDLAASFIAVSLGIVSLRKQSGSIMDAGLQRVTWIGLGALLAEIIVGFVIGLMVVLPRLGSQGSTELFAPQHGPVIDPYFASVAAVLIVLAVIGLMRLSRYRARYAALQAAPTRAESAEESPA